MPKTPAQVDSVKSNPFITKSISKSLLTPCRQVGLSRKRKTPNSANSSFSESFVNPSVSSSLETTPVSANSLAPIAEDGKVISEQILNSKVKKKARVSKRLITDDESSENSTSDNANKKQCLVDSRNEETVILETKDGDFDVDQEKSSKNQTTTKVESKTTKNEIKLRKSPRKNKKAVISSDEEDTNFGNTKSCNKSSLNVQQGSRDMNDFKNSEDDSNIKKQSEKSCVETKDGDQEMSSTKLVGCKVKSKTTKNEIKLRKSPRKSKKAIISSDEEDTYYENNKSCKSSLNVQKGSHDMNDFKNTEDGDQETSSMKQVGCKVESKTTKSEIKLRKSPRKSKKAIISSDEEDTYYENNKSCKSSPNVQKGSHDMNEFKNSGNDPSVKEKEKSCVVKASSKSKKRESKDKPKLSQRNKQKIITILSDDDDDDFNNKNNKNSHKNVEDVHQKSTSETSSQEINNLKVNGDSIKDNIKPQEKETKEDTATLHPNHEKKDENDSQSVFKDVTNETDLRSPPTAISDHDYFVKSKQKTKKIKRSLSMKKSTSEDKNPNEDLAIKDCVITLTPIDMNSDSKDKFPSTEDIQNLEKQVNEKRKLLDDLRQAEIYKKKHNLKELQELTARWKTGCILALNDLLPQLQQHAAIDMATLLKNLHIPPEMVTLSQDGNLI
ncbi:hypothetical protein Zmor_025927 [Zophobas morio]|uniref:Swi5-dependent recombination DNA repair protein 1 homolog n=1 Tax=Zophobas morio TaxID=2755281 RepID=A0AA38HSG9_9CUCU|nr:hypothetical protein Zmor_025927 [Zophobas morio]